MAQWKPYNGEIIEVGNRDLPPGYYRFRVKGKGGKGDSPVVLSPAFSYTAPLAPEAPTNLTVDTEDKTVAFTFNPEFTELGDYSYSTNGGLTWGVVEANPIQLTNKSYKPGDILIKVASSKSPLESKSASYEGYITAPYQPKSTPDKPENLVLNTETREFTWDIADGLEVEDYEWCMRGSSKFPKISLGTEVWMACRSNPQPVITGLPINPNSLSIRVKGTEGRNPSRQTVSPDELPLSKPPAAIPEMIIDEDIRTIRFEHELGVYDLGIGLDFSTFLGRRDTNRYQIGKEAVNEGKWRAGFVGARYVDQANSPVIIAPAFEAKAPVTPPAPRVYTDDLNNTIFAISPFDIEVSINDSAFSDYTGEIVGDDTNVPPGYYKFRVKQQTYINNSEVAESGPLTQDTQASTVFPLNLNNITL